MKTKMNTRKPPNVIIKCSKRFCEGIFNKSIRVLTEGSPFRFNPSKIYLYDGSGIVGWVNHIFLISSNENACKLWKQYGGFTSMKKGKFYTLFKEGRLFCIDQVKRFGEPRKLTRYGCTEMKNNRFYFNLKCESCGKLFSEKKMNSTYRHCHECSEGGRNNRVGSGGIDWMIGTPFSNLVNIGVEHFLYMESTRCEILPECVSCIINRQQQSRRVSNG